MMEKSNYEKPSPLEVYEIGCAVMPLFGMMYSKMTTTNWLLLGRFYIGFASFKLNTTLFGDQA